MQKHLMNITRCDACNSDSVRNRAIGSRHSSGEWNEKLEFDCGRSYSYSPNFKAVAEDGKCRHNREYIAAKHLAIELKPKIVAFAREQGLSESAVKYIEREIAYLESYV
jgi:hypothetical protein